MPDIAKCNTEHGHTQLSTGLAVMSLSAVPKILKTPNNFPNDSAEQHKLVSASASALRGTETQVAICNLKPRGATCDVTPSIESSLPLLWFPGPRGFLIHGRRISSSEEARKEKKKYKKKKKRSDIFFRCSGQKMFLRFGQVLGGTGLHEHTLVSFVY